ncbi:hypothetical protein P389DRAFT_171579 [Cystobasidium minutum MCA 4210]|uniref:uncharacterized protein n=1 Tax=Cystobasidium minutum MCA 4210 TaxID=1397322 RepID=UPI0034CF1F92|eukprot:jgi/Rhomi1/171579/fgenesh1_kg.4_\
MATAAILPSIQWSSDAALPVSMMESSSSSSIHDDTTRRSNNDTSTSKHHSNYQQPIYSYSGYPNDTLSSSSTTSHFIQPTMTSSSSLFSRSELQAIDGFLDSFSAPSLPQVTSNNNNSNAFQQPLPYSSSTAFYRPEYESNTGWRGGATPSTVASSSVGAGAYNQQAQYGKYASYYPTASTGMPHQHHHRPSSPSSASASSSSYPKTVGQADHTTATSSATGNTSRPPRLSNSPFSSASHAEESLDERDKRLRSQADDLAGWLSRYNSNSNQSQQHQQHHQTVSYPNHKIDRSYHDSSVYSHRPAQTSGPSSIGSTSNSESISTPSTKAAAPQRPYVNTQYGDFNLPGSIDPHEMSLSASKPAQVAAPAPTVADDASEQTTTAVSMRKASIETAAEKGKSKAAKHAGPAKKKTSSTTASVRDKKKPAPKAPAKATKSAASPPSESSSAAVKATSHASLPQPSNDASHATTAPASTTNAAKAALSEEQKRANHIASEQKRRHAIRAAYDALCTVVPSLSAAVKEYEDRLSKLHPSAALNVKAGVDDSMDVEASTSSGIAPLQTVAGVLTGGIEVGGEKIDGRAGPRSEAVVLAKTVEYMRDLLDQREDSLARLQKLHDQLHARGHTPNPANAVDAAAPWNVKWSSKHR